MITYMLKCHQAVLERRTDDSVSKARNACGSALLYGIHRLRQVDGIAYLTGIYHSFIKSIKLRILWTCFHDKTSMDLYTSNKMWLQYSALKSLQSSTINELASLSPLHPVHRTLRLHG